MHKIAFAAFVDELEQIKLAKPEGKLLELASKMRAQKIGPYGARISKLAPSAPLTGGITPGVFGKAPMPKGNVPKPSALVTGAV